MLGFARHLPRHDWRAVAVAPPSLPWEPTDPGLCTQLPPETVVRQVPYLRSRVARRLVQYAGWLPRAATACEAAIREFRPEAMLTSGPPHQIHWLGLWLKHRHGLPWFADFRDPWFPNGRSERDDSFASRSVAWQEALVFRAADVVIANAPAAREALCQAYPKLSDKFVTLPNGYDREKFAALAAGWTPRAAESPLRLVHTGAIYVGRNPLPLLDAVRKLRDGAAPRPWDVRFFGPAPESGIDLAAETSARGLGDAVTFHGQVSYDRALREMVEADVLLLMDSPGRAIGVPAKVYEYIGAGRPILALGERGGDLERVLSESGVPHRIAPPTDVDAIADALASLVSAATRGVSVDPHRFSREAITGRLAALLDAAQTPIARESFAAGGICT